MRRTDVLFFGSMFGILLLLIITIIFNIGILLTLFKGYWITWIWLLTLTIIILPVRFFPNTRLAKWWNGRAFPKKVTD